MKPTRATAGGGRPPKMSPPADKLLVRNALILTAKPGEEPYRGYLRVGADGKIAGLGAGDPPAGADAVSVIDASGRFVAPGFVSAHSHLFQSPLRGLGSDRTLYGWLDSIHELVRFARPEDLYWFCRHGAADFLRNGVTTAYDFTFSGELGGGQKSIGIGEAPERPPPDQEPYEQAQIRAKLDAGIRFVNSVSIVPLGTERQIHRRFGRIVDYARTFAGDPLFLKMAISGWVQRAPGPEAARREVRCMREFGLVNQAHFLESPERVPEQQAKFAWYREAGALGPDFIFGHYIHTTPEIVAATAAAGAHMCWQPLANGRLGSGVADIPAYRRAGIKVGMGLDDQSCADLADPFENLRTGLYAIRDRYQDAGILSVRDMLYLHTLGSAEILGVADRVGSLEPGKFADFLIVDPRMPDTGPVHDPVATYVLACGLRNLQQVYVAGERVADGCVLVRQDEAEIRRQIDARMARLQLLAGKESNARTPN